MLVKKTVLFFCSLIALVTGLAQKTVPVNPLEHIGDTITISGRIYAGYYLVHVNTKPTFLNLFDSLPNHRLMIRIDSADRGNFSQAPEKYFLNKKVNVTGVVTNYKGSAMIRVADSTMITTDDFREADTAFQRSSVVNNKFVPVVDVPRKKSDTVSQLPVPKTDTVLQSKWIEKVAGKSYQQTLTDIRIVDKEIPLRVNPGSNSPVIAELQPGIAISILYRSRKWSYITVRKPDGTGGVYGFIKTRTYRHLKKQVDQ